MEKDSVEVKEAEMTKIKEQIEEVNEKIKMFHEQ